MVDVLTSNYPALSFPLLLARNKRRGIVFAIFAFQQQKMGENSTHRERPRDNGANEVMGLKTPGKTIPAQGHT